MTNSTNAPAAATTAAFGIQAMLSFGVSLAAVIIGVLYLPADPWVKGFLAVGILYVVTSAFTLAKVVRDKQDGQTVVHRVDQARMDKLLAEHDPFRAA